VTPARLWRIAWLLILVGAAVVLLGITLAR
jgi:hypothetical protein